MSNEQVGAAAKIAQIPQTVVTDPQLRPVVEAVKNIFNTRAFGKNPLEKWVTWRDLVDSNLVIYKNGNTTYVGSGNNTGFLPLPGGEDDFTPPPAPTGFSVDGAFNNILLDWDDPTDAYSNHSYTEIWRSGENNLGTAVLVGQAPGAVYADPVATSTTFYYWIRFISRANVNGPYNSLIGTAGQTALDPAYALQVLSGAITETQLFSSLGDRIDLIDAPATTPNSVSAKVQAEASIRAQAILDEAAARQTQDAALQTQINVLSAASSGDFQDLIAAVQEEQTARIAGDAAEAASRETLATQVRGSYAGTDLNMLTTGLLYSERVARSSADSTISSSVTALSSTVSNNFSTLNSAITTESTTRASADATLTTNLDALSSTVTSNNTAVNAAITSEATTRASADTALTNSVNSLSSTVTNNYNTLNAAIVSEASTRADADSAFATQLDTVSAQATKTRTYRQTTAPTSGMVTGDLWFDTDDNNKAYRYSGTAWEATDDTRISTNAAAIQTESTTRANADSSLASQITTVQAVADLKNRIYRQTSAPTGTLAVGDLWFDTDDNNKPSRWTGLSWDSVEDPRIPANAVSIQTEATARANADNSLFAQYTVKIDANGYVSGFGLASTTIDAIPFSDFTVRADRFSVASPTGPGITPIVPFIVTTTPQTIGGVSVPAGVYMDSAFIQNGSISNVKIGNAAIDSVKIADAAIVNAKIGTAAINAVKIQDATITGAKIASATITSANIANAAIGTAQIGDAAITAAKIGSAQITAAKIADGNITNAKIQDGAITNAKIGDAQITNAKISTLDAGKINTGTLSADRISAGSIDGKILTVDGAKISNATITTAKIGSAQIDTLRIAGNAVTTMGAVSGAFDSVFYLNAPYGGQMVVMGYLESISSTGGWLTVYVNGSPVFSLIGSEYVGASDESGPVYYTTSETGIAQINLGPGNHSVYCDGSGRGYTVVAFLTQR